MGTLSITHTHINIHKHTHTNTINHTNSHTQVVEEALLVCKWGGVLTHAGRQQAEDLGKVFRLVMYPRCVLCCCKEGLLRLHSKLSLLFNPLTTPTSLSSVSLTAMALLAEAFCACIQRTGTT